MLTYISLGVLATSCLLLPCAALPHPPSPCPSVFSYEGAEPESDRWYGEIVVNTREYLVGVRLNLQLDRRVHLMVSWLGDVTTTDNKEFTILNLEQRLDPHRPLTTRIMVRFEASGGSPKMKNVYLNGKQICPGEPPIQANALNKNNSKPTSSVLKRPDPIFITDTVYNPSITTYDDYYSEFFSINQQNSMKKNPDKVYANTESSVPESGYAKPHKTTTAHKTRPSNTADAGYSGHSNTDYASENTQGNKKKPQEEPEYNQPKPQTYPDPYARPQTNTDEYYNPRPQTNTGYNSRPQTNTDTGYNVRPQSNSESNYNARPQSNSETSYNTRPQTNSQNTYNARPQTNAETVYNTRPQSTYENSYDTISRPQTNPSNGYNSGGGSGSSYNSGSPGNGYNSGSNTGGTYNSVSRPQVVPDTSYNSKPQTTYVDSYRPQENSEGGYVPQTNSGSSYNSNTDSGYNGNSNIQQQATVHNGYSTISSNSRPSGSNGQKPQSQNPGDISDIAEHLIEDGDANKTVIITVIKHNPQETTTETYKATTSSPKQKSTSKPNNSNNNNNNDKNTGNKGQPLNTQHSQKRPAENNNKKPNNNNGQSSNSNKEVTCGSVVYNKAQPLVTNGQKTARGQWPWHAALYKTEGINLSYICGGSLITSNYVITAAHCVTKKPYDKPVDSDTLVIYLGKYHQHQFSDEGGVQNKQVQRIHVYPSYNSSNYLGDVALLRLSSEVDYSVYVRPVCLWDESTAPLTLSAVEGLDGTVIGWGYDENDRVSEELKMAIMPIVSHQQCLWSNPQFFSQFTSDETYCAGFRNGTSVCNGDSGGGMVFKMDATWYLRGIVSITVARDGLRICDTKHYVVFTDVAKYLAWVRPIISN